MFICFRMNQRLVCDCYGSSGWLDSVPVTPFFYLSKETLLNEDASIPPASNQSNPINQSSQSNDGENDFEEPIIDTFKPTADISLIPQAEIVYAGPVKSRHTIDCVRWNLDYNNQLFSDKCKAE